MSIELAKVRGIETILQVANASARLDLFLSISKIRSGRTSIPNVSFTKASLARIYRRVVAALDLWRQDPRAESNVSFKFTSFSFIGPRQPLVETRSTDRTCVRRDI